MDFIAEITAKMQLMTEEQKQDFIKSVYKYLSEDQKGANNVNNLYGSGTKEAGSH